MTLGKASIRVDGYEGEYIGELNYKEEAYGEGSFTNAYGETYKGIFFWNRAEGYCKYNLKEKELDIE